MGYTYGNSGGGGSAFVEVANYSALPAANTVTGQTYVCLASQGSRWLFNYYSEGLYYSNGVTWIYRPDPLVATQAEMNTGTNQDKYGTPETINNLSKWSLYQLVLTASNFATFLLGLSSKSTPADADELIINDVAGGNVSKRLSWVNIKTTIANYYNSLTATLTNKTIQPRVLSIVSSATPTINTDNYDFVEITALATNITSMTTGLSGTPFKRQMLHFEFADNGVSRTITWGPSFEAKGQALPGSTTAGKRTQALFTWSTVTNKWGCIDAIVET